MCKTAFPRLLPWPAYLLLAAGWSGEEFSFGEETEFLGKSVSDWTRQLKDSSEPARLQAVFALGEMGPGATQTLLAALRSKESAMRARAATGLGKIGAAKGLAKETHEGIVVALSRALSDPEGTVRVAAAAALARCGKVAPALEVLTAAFSDPLDGVRIEAASALHDLGEAARPALPALRAATEDSNEYVKRLATRAVARLTNDAP